jgi:transcriptional regulator with XRE-family HTH domain
MKSAKKKKLEAAGWKVGSVSEFLGLNSAEQILVNMKISLALRVKAMRQQKKLTQSKLATLVGSSQSRVAKIERADPSVSMDLMVRSLVVMGATSEQVGNTFKTAVIGPRSKKAIRTISAKRVAKKATRKKTRKNIRDAAKT